MYLLEYITESLSTIRANKLRSSLSLIGIIVGVTSVVSLVGMGNGMQEQLKKTFRSSNNMITIAQGAEGTSGMAMMVGGMQTSSSSTPGDTPYEVTYGIERLFSMDMVERLQKNFHTNIIAILPKYGNLSASLTYKGTAIYAGLVAGSDDYFRARNISIGYGIGFSPAIEDAEQRVVLIGSNHVQQTFQGIHPIGESISINGQSYTVIGVLEKTDDYSLDSSIFLPLKVAKRQFDMSKIESIEVFVSDVTQINTTKTQLSTWLSKYFPTFTDQIFHLQTNQRMIEEMEKMNDSFALFIIGIASISLFVGGIGIMNVMLVSVTERTREIGIRKAIGATRGDIMLQFLVESGTITGIGGILAIGLSFFLGNFLIKFIPGDLTFIIDTQTVLMTTGFSIFMGIFFGLIPAWKAAKKNPIDALRFE